jgi:hypothetical protein
VGEPGWARRVKSAAAAGAATATRACACVRACDCVWFGAACRFTAWWDGGRGLAGCATVGVVVVVLRVVAECAGR